MTYTIMAAYRDEESTKTLTNDDDVAEFLKFMLTEAAADPANTCAWLYVEQREQNARGVWDHEMRVGVVPSLDAWALGFTDVSGSMYVKGRDSSLDEIPLAADGNNEHFPGDSLLDLETVRNAIVEVLQTGERPTSVEWSPIR